MVNKDPRKNGEGYFDFTAHAAIKSADEEIDRLNRLLRTIFYICDVAGYKVDGRITLIDLKNGKVWK